ncbi:hypothetical protein M3J09_004558 [Ascochyta lentis]
MSAQTLRRCEQQLPALQSSPRVSPASTAAAPLVAIGNPIDRHRIPSNHPHLFIYFGICPSCWPSLDIVSRNANDCFNVGHPSSVTASPLRFHFQRECLSQQISLVSRSLLCYQPCSWPLGLQRKGQRVYHGRGMTPCWSLLWSACTSS